MHLTPFSASLGSAGDDSSPGLSGKTCVITGATSGIGRMTAKALGAMNANLILVGRNERAGKALLQRLKQLSAGSRLEFIRTDLSSQRDIRQLARTIAANDAPIDILINNAGARFDQYGESSDGIELTFATNHLSHFLLTFLLVERIALAPAARIVTVSSGSHVGATSTGEWCLSRAQYDRRLAYARSKLANIMFASELARRLSSTRIASNSFEPGGVASNFARNNGPVSWLRHLVAHALRRDLVSPRKGAEPLVYLASSDQVAGITEKHFRRSREVEPSFASRDVEEARRLWDLSLELTKLKRDPAFGTRALLV